MTMARGGLDRSLRPAPGEELTHRLQELRLPKDLWPELRHVLQIFAEGAVRILGAKEARKLFQTETGSNIQRAGS